MGKMLEEVRKVSEYSSPDRMKLMPLRLKSSLLIRPFLAWPLHDVRTARIQQLLFIQGEKGAPCILRFQILFEKFHKWSDL
jgi:hypothetical protein